MTKRRQPVKWDPDWCLRPGVTLQEEMDELRLPMVSWAKITGLSEDRIRGIIAGEPITEDDAAGLGRMPAGASARFWMALERNYRAALAAGKRDISDG